MSLLQKMVPKHGSIKWTLICCVSVIGVDNMLYAALHRVLQQFHHKRSNGSRTEGE